MKSPNRAQYRKEQMMTRTTKYRDRSRRAFNLPARVIIWVLVTGVLEGILTLVSMYLSINDPSWVNDYYILVIAKLGFYAIPILVLGLDIIL